MSQTNEPRWTRDECDSDSFQLKVFLSHAGNRPVLQYVATARPGSWDLQDRDGYVYAYGSGESLIDSQQQASGAFLVVMEQLRSQLG